MQGQEILNQRERLQDQIDALTVERDRLRAFAEGIAEGDCYDPGHVRSYVCDVCRAKEALNPSGENG